MKLETAQQRIAGLLAHDTWQAIESSKAIPALAENTAAAIQCNHAAAAAFGIVADYSRSCHLFGIGNCQPTQEETEL